MRTKESTTLLYQQIYEDLADKIATGVIGYQERLPALPELCRLYGVSEAPVRRALDELERGNFILRQRGRGKGTLAIRRPTPYKMRVLLMDDLDTNRNPIELCYEVYDFLRGIRTTAAERDAQVQLISRRSSESQPEASEDTGYLIIAQGGAGYREGIEIAERHSVPYVLVNPPDRLGPCVRVDMQHGAYLGVRHLLMLGHRRIGYVGKARGDWFEPRFSGYCQALAEFDVSFAPALLIETDGVDRVADERALDALLSLPDPPTALFACSDYRALHLLAYCRRRGLDVPGDLSLCGYDNVEESGSVEPALTTVHHPRVELGEEAVKLLAGILRRQVPQKPDTVFLPHLIERASSAPPQDRRIS